MSREPFATMHYTRVASLLHWVIAALIITQITLGLLMDHGGVDETLSFTFFQTHRLLGILTFILVLVRVTMRLFYKPPSLASNVPVGARYLASLVHGVLYGLQLFAPLSGWVLASSAAIALPITLFGGVDFPLLPMPADGSLEAPMRLVHHWAGWIFAALILFHIAASFIHSFLWKDRIFNRINPFFRA